MDIQVNNDGWLVDDWTGYQGITLDVLLVEIHWFVSIFSAGKWQF